MGRRYMESWAAMVDAVEKRLTWQKRTAGRLKDPAKIDDFANWLAAQPRYSLAPDSASNVFAIPRGDGGGIANSLRPVIGREIKFPSGKCLSRKSVFCGNDVPGELQRGF